MPRVSWSPLGTCGYTSLGCWDARARDYLARGSTPVSGTCADPLWETHSLGACAACDALRNQRGLFQAGSQIGEGGVCLAKRVPGAVIRRSALKESGWQEQEPSPGASPAMLAETEHVTFPSRFLVCRRRAVTELARSIMGRTELEWT